MARTIWVSKSFNGRFWEPAIEYGETTQNSPDDGPAAVVFLDNAYIFFRRQSDNGLRYFAIDNAGNYVIGKDVGSQAESGPAATLRGNGSNEGVFVFYHRSGVLYYRRVWGGSIDPEKQFCKLGTGTERGLGQPAAATFLGHPYVFFRTTAGVVCHYSDDNTGTVKTMMLPTQITSPGKVSACVYQGLLTVAAFNTNIHTTLLTSYDGSTWSPPQKITDSRNWNQINPCGMANYSGRAHLFYSIRGGAIRYRTYDGNTSSVEKLIEYIDGHQRADYPISPFNLGGELHICYQSQTL